MECAHSAVRWLLILLAATAVGACSSSAKRLAKEMEVNEIRREAEEERIEIAQEKAEDTLDDFPQWALTVPPPDGEGIYAIGMSTSDSIPIALRKAQMEASYGLAKLYAQELSGGERMAHYDRKSTSTSTYTNLIDVLVDWTPVVGFNVIKQELKPIDGKFHAFMLVQLPYEEFNDVLQQRKQQAQDARVRADFEDLERRLQRLRDIKRDQALSGSPNARPEDQGLVEVYPLPE